MRSKFTLLFAGVAYFTAQHLTFAADFTPLAFESHGKLLGTSSYYKDARTYAQEPDRFADALTGVYATDPQYGETLKWVMENYKLKQYDLAAVRR